MTEQEVEDTLIEMLYDSDPESFPSISGWDSFEGKGIMTYNKGIVLTMEDGSEFQLSIVKSK